MICVSIYLMLGSVGSAILEIFPVFAATLSKYNGLNLGPSEIGLVILGSGIIVIISQIFIIHRATGLFGAKSSFIGASICLSFNLLLIPTIGEIANKMQIKVFAAVLHGLANAFVAVQLIQINILTRDCAPSNVLGFANGITLAASRLGRAIGPALFGGAYSWSLTNVVGVAANAHPLGFPFNQYFVYILLSLCSLVLAMICSFLTSKDTSEVQSGSK